MKIPDSQKLITNALFLFVLLLIPANIISQTTAEKKRQFDFWIGEWDVNLRVMQKDKSWKDQHKSVARIYSILDGKAILELWSENQNGINGYSLRYYNPKKDKWELWLNWAGKNRSGTNGLEGSFRHGRGEFFIESKVDEKTTQISRYTFSDATPNSLRWDDGYSRDGGKTWSGNWIMEFSRRAKTAPAIDKDKNLLTYFNGNRCDMPEFNVLKQLSANNKNSPSLRLYNILDGCIVIGFVKKKSTTAFFTLTYNTFAKLYEFTYLDDQPDSALGMYYGPKTNDGFTLQKRGAIEKAIIKSDQTIKSIEVENEGKSQSFKF
jgi:hypothetical protein